MESAIVFGADREMAGKYIANVRQAVLKELKAAYHKMEIVEDFSYSKGSCFRESGAEPERSKEAKGWKEAIGCNKRTREK